MNWLRVCRRESKLCSSYIPRLHLYVPVVPCTLPARGCASARADARARSLTIQLHSTACLLRYTWSLPLLTTRLVKLEYNIGLTVYNVPGMSSDRLGTYVSRLDHLYSPRPAMLCQTPTEYLLNFLSSNDLNFVIWYPIVRWIRSLVTWYNTGYQLSRNIPTLGYTTRQWRRQFILQLDWKKREKKQSMIQETNSWDGYSDWQFTFHIWQVFCKGNMHSVDCEGPHFEIQKPTPLLEGPFLYTVNDL